MFFAALIPLTGIVEALIVRRIPGISRTVLVLVLMWMPAVASIVARLVTREGFGDLSLRLGGRRGARALFVAAAYPLLVGAIAYSIAWGAHLAAFEPPTEDMAFALPRWMVPLTGSPAARFAKSLAIHLTVGAVSGCIFAAGEEIGWRGYLAPRLLDARVRGAIPLSGLVWSMWHWPLMIGSKSPHPALVLGLFTLELVPMSGLMTRLRLESGSVLPAIVLHALWNELLGLVFDGFTEAPTLWVGETGSLVVGAAILLTLPFLRGRWAARRAPGEPPYASVGFLS